MRIKELADLTGTTVRTVRYYHQTGLLPVPEVRFGCRDYELVHVARLIRIRWLAQAGVPLSRIAGMLGAPVERTSPQQTGAQQTGPEAGESATTERDSILLDLGATVVALDEQLERLQEQRDRVRRLVAAVEHGENLSPMPAALVRFYDGMEQRTEDERVRQVIRRERDFMELAYYRGDMPAEAAVLYEGFDDTRLAESLALFGQVAERYAPGSALTAEQIEQTVTAVVDRVSRHLGPDRARVFSAVDLDVARRAAELYLRLADRKNRPLDRAIADGLLAAIEKEHTP